MEQLWTIETHNRFRTVPRSSIFLFDIFFYVGQVHQSVKVYSYRWKSANNIIVVHIHPGQIKELL